MNEWSVYSPIPASTAQVRRPHDSVLLAISDLADQVRAHNLDHADNLLAELLALLYAEQGD